MAHNLLPVNQKKQPFVERRFFFELTHREGHTSQIGTTMHAEETSKLDPVADARSRPQSARPSPNKPQPPEHSSAGNHSISAQNTPRLLFQPHSRSQTAGPTNMQNPTRAPSEDKDTGRAPSFPSGNGDHEKTFWATPRTSQSQGGTTYRSYSASPPSKRGIASYVGINSTLSASPPQNRSMVTYLGSTMNSTSRSRPMSAVVQGYTQRQQNTPREDAPFRMGFYSVVISKKDAEGLPVDFTHDYRQYAYADFHLPQGKVQGTLNPSAILEWVSKAKPRNQDDVYPLLQLSQGVLQDMMRDKIKCQSERETGLAHDVQELQKQLASKGEEIDKLKADNMDLTEHLTALDSDYEMLRQKAQELGVTHIAKRMMSTAAKHKMEDVKSQASNLQAQVKELQKTIDTLNKRLDDRTEELVKMNNQLNARKAMPVREQISEWNLDRRSECLKVLLHSDQPACWHALDAKEFTRADSKLVNELARAMLLSLKTSSQSWLQTVSRLFDTIPSEFYQVVASWYKKEPTYTTDDVKYHDKVVEYLDMINKHKFAPLYKLVSKDIKDQRVTIEEVLLQVSDKPKDQVIFDMIGLTAEEINIFKERKTDILEYTHARITDDVGRRKKQARLNHAGFLHKGITLDCEAMEVHQLYSIISCVFAKKIGNGSRDSNYMQQINIMKTTKNMLLLFNNKDQAAILRKRLVKAVLENASSCPRVRIFALLTGMEKEDEWFERSTAFVMAFLGKVIRLLMRRLHSTIINDFTGFGNETNTMKDKDSVLHSAPFLVLGDKDVEIPLSIALQSAYYACETHPCGYGYPKAEMQEIFEKASSNTFFVNGGSIKDFRFRLEEIANLGNALVFDSVKGDFKEEPEFTGPNYMRPRNVQETMDMKARSLKKHGASGGGGLTRRRKSIEGDPMAAQFATTVGTRGPRPSPSREVSPNNSDHELPLVFADPEAEKYAPESKAEQIRFLEKYFINTRGRKTVWLDVFLLELLLAWFKQHEQMEAHLIRLFDKYDENVNGSLELTDFINLINQTELAKNMTEEQTVQMYYELSSDSEGKCITKYQWVELFQNTQFKIIMDLYKKEQEPDEMDPIFREDALDG